MTILSLLNNVHHLQGDIQALPNDVLSAINQLSSLIGVTAANLTSILTGAGSKPRSIIPILNDKKISLFNIEFNYELLFNKFNQSNISI